MSSDDQTFPPRDETYPGEPKESLSNAPTQVRVRGHLTAGGESVAIPPDLLDHARYEILALLGRGGMGMVFKARHRLMGREVALKVINPHLLDDPQMVTRFRREVWAAARLVHPNIVTAYDADQAG